MKSLRTACTAIALFLAAHPAAALEAGDPCSIEGSHTWTNDTEGSYHFVCDGAEWGFVATFQQDGQAGIGDAVPDGTLTLDVEGQIGATEYCDEDGDNCFTAAGVGGGGGATAGGPEGAIQFNNSSAMAGSSSFVYTSAGTVGIGTASPSAALHVIKTTEQSRLGYDASNYMTTTVGSTGIVTLDAAGSGAKFVFSDAISSPGGGANSERFGAGADAGTAPSVTVVGASASYTGNGTGASVAVGRAASASQQAVSLGSSANANAAQTVAIGNNAVASQAGSVAVGFSASTTNSSSVAIGSSAAANGGFGTAVGTSSLAKAGSIAIGYSADAQGTTGHSVSSIAIGYDATALSKSIALGYEATTTAANQLVIGGATWGIADAYIGTGVTHATPTAVTLNATGGSGTDIAGAALQLAGGKGTGNAAGGSILFQTSDAGASGTTLQSLTTKVAITAAGNVGIGTTSPNEKLHVVGSMRLSGSVKVDNYQSLQFKDTGGTDGYGQIFVDSAVGSFAGVNGMAFYLNGAGRMAITSGGNVGVGTTSPTQKFEVSGVTNNGTWSGVTNSSSGTLATAELFARNGTTETSGAPIDALRVGVLGTGFTTTGTLVQDSAFINAESNLSGGLSLMTRANAPIRFATNGHANERMRITEGGNVGIGKTDPSVALDVVGDINFTGDINDVSDRRMKENIHPLSGQLDKVTALEGVSFTMKGDDKTELGLIAQDVETLYPQLVKTMPDGMKTLNYLGLIAPLIEAVKEQQREIDLLRAENEALRGENSTLDRRLSDLETRARLRGPPADE